MKLMARNYTRFDISLNQNRNTAVNRSLIDCFSLNNVRSIPFKIYMFILHLISDKHTISKDEISFRKTESFDSSNSLDFRQFIFQQAIFTEVRFIMKFYC